MSDANRGVVLRIGTRGSQLARDQAGTIRDLLISAGYRAELVIVQTIGDQIMSPVQRIGVGVFTSQLRDKLIGGDVDIAVHSFKDLPTAPEPRVDLAATPARANPADAFVSRGGVSVTDLPRGAHVGTSAPRRISQLRALRPDLEIVPLRGNVISRLSRVETGELDAVILAQAGLSRLGLADRASHIFSPEEMLPAPAQGVLAVETSHKRPDLTSLVAEVCDDLYARVASTAERQFLATLEAGCTAPIGALATVCDRRPGHERTVTLQGVVSSLDGQHVLRVQESGFQNEAVEIGKRAARRLLDEGASQLMRSDALKDPNITENWQGNDRG